MKQLKDYLHFYLGCEVINIDGEDFNCGTTATMCYTDRLYVYASKRDNAPESELSEYEWSISSIKPILRPLSDMTKEEYNEWANIEPLITGTSELVISEAEKTKYLLSKHFDLFGLIEAGLAIDKTSLK